MDTADLVLIAGAVGLLFLMVRNMNSSAGADVSTDTTDNSGGDSSVPDTPGGIASISDWANAIFHFEGGNPGNLNVRNNNPGNLKFANQPGAVGQDSKGFAIFDSMDSGFAALNAQLNKYVSEFPSFSLTQMMSRYLGQSGLNPQKTNQGDPFAYADYIAGKLGVSADDSLQTIFGGNS